MPDAGPPPVSRAVQPASQMSDAARNYLTVVDTLKANQGAEARAIRAMFGGDKGLMDRFLAVSFSLLQSNPKILTDCDPMSIVQCLKDAASLGLTPLTDEAAIVPYGRTAKLMPMWRGYIKRIRNSREVVDLDTQIVYMNDVFELELGTSPSLKHVPKLYGEKDEAGHFNEERGDYRGAYAWALMPSGKYIIEWMTADDLNEVRDRWGNKSRNGPWDTSWPEMARKTVIRRLAKRLPSAAVDKLLEVDKASDEAAEAIHAAAAKVDDSLSEVRQLALRAVGQLPPGDVAGEPARTNEEQSAPEEEPEAQPAAPEPVSVNPTDPNVTAAMRLAEEQEQLARQRSNRK